MIKKSFLFQLKTSFCSFCFLGEAEKEIDQKDNVNLRIYDIATREANNYNTLGSKDNQTMKFGQLIEYNIEIFFLKNHTQNVGEKLFQALFLKNQS